MDNRFESMLVLRIMCKMNPAWLIILSKHGTESRSRDKWINIHPFICAMVLHSINTRIIRREHCLTKNHRQSWLFLAPSHFLLRRLYKVDTCSPRGPESSPFGFWVLLVLPWDILKSRKLLFHRILGNTYKIVPFAILCYQKPEKNIYFFF